jgi:hypothetical protein
MDAEFLLILSPWGAAQLLVPRRELHSGALFFAHWRKKQRAGVETKLPEGNLSRDQFEPDLESFTAPPVGAIVLL